MELVAILQALGEEGFREAATSVSISRLKTYQLYESLKTWAHVPKLNVQGLRKAVPRFWERIQSGDKEFAPDLVQAILVSHLDMIIEILDFLGVPHREGFFDKDLDVSSILTGDWRAKAYERFKDDYSRPVLVFYLNHLAWELTKAEDLFAPAGEP